MDIFCALFSSSQVPHTEISETRATFVTTNFVYREHAYKNHFRSAHVIINLVTRIEVCEAHLSQEVTQVCRSLLFIGHFRGEAANSDQNFQHASRGSQELFEWLFMNRWPSMTSRFLSIGSIRLYFFLCNFLFPLVAGSSNASSLPCRVHCLFQWFVTIRRCCCLLSSLVLAMKHKW